MKGNGSLFLWTTPRCLIQWNCPRWCNWLRVSLFHPHLWGLGQVLWSSARPIFRGIWCTILWRGVVLWSCLRWRWAMPVGQNLKFPRPRCCVSWGMRHRGSSSRMAVDFLFGSRRCSRLPFLTLFSSENLERAGKVNAFISLHRGNNAAVPRRSSWLGEISLWKIQNWRWWLT